MCKQLLVVVAAVAVLSACGPTIGSPCELENRATCASESSALYCEGGSYKQYACPGENGCTESVAMENAANCDVRGVSANTPCPQHFLGFARCTGTSRMVCDNELGERVWRWEQCANGCEERSGVGTCL